jgi:uncharacterized membrane protein SpoIIM required for sporulation
MTPQEFSRRHEADWQRFADLLRDRHSPDRGEFPARYREICAHLALARDRHYPLALVEQLNDLALAGQQRLYRHQGGLWPAFLEFLSAGFPALVRRHAGLFWLAAACFYLPMLGMAVAIWWQPELIYSVMPAGSVRDFEAMYAPGKSLLGARPDDSRFMMFGYYLQHNTGIGFQTFAGGIFAGLGSLFFLLFNAIAIGAVAGHLTRIGYHENFLSFVVTHSAFELTAIVLSGMAGLLLGLALAAPGARRRKDALILRGREAIRLVYGAALLFLVAAAVEGFWSSSTSIPASVKYAVGGLAWLAVSSWLLLAGRSRHAH